MQVLDRKVASRSSLDDEEAALLKHSDSSVAQRKALPFMYFVRMLTASRAGTVSDDSCSKPCISSSGSRTAAYMNTSRPHFSNF